MVARRRARAAVAGLTEVGARLQSPLRQLRRASITRIRGKLGHIGRNVGDQPVPESAPGGSIGIKAGDRKALGAGRRARPRKVRRLVFSRAAKAETGGQDMLFAVVIAVLEAVAPHRECHGRNSSHYYVS